MSGWDNLVLDRLCEGERAKEPSACIRVLHLSFPNKPCVKKAALKMQYRLVVIDLEAEQFATWKFVFSIHVRKFSPLSEELNRACLQRTSKAKMNL